MKVAILTDTNSGIFTPDENAGLFVLPMPNVIGDDTYYEGENLSEKELCQFMEQGEKVTTSQPPIGMLMDKLDSILAAGYEEVVYIPMSSSMSSSCQTASLVANEYGGKVHVADNHRISVTQKIPSWTPFAWRRKEPGARRSFAIWKKMPSTARSIFPFPLWSS